MQSMVNDIFINKSTNLEIAKDMFLMHSRDNPYGLEDTVNDWDEDGYNWTGSPEKYLELYNLAKEKRG